MEDAVEAIVNLILVRDRRRHWEQPDWALHQCEVASERLVDELRAAGIDAKVLWFRGPCGDRSREHPHAAQSPVHMTVQVHDAFVIDLTRRQWDSKAEHPTVYPPLAAAGVHWSAYYPDGETRRAATVPLDPP